MNTEAMDALIARAQARFEQNKAAQEAEKLAREREAKRIEAAAIAASDSLLASLKARSDAFLADLAKHPHSLPCKHHEGATAILNEEASLEAGKPVYRCPRCVSSVAEQRRERRMIEAGIPADVRHATLDNFQTERENVKTEKGYTSPAGFLAKARQFQERGIRNLFLCGSVGIGKGHLAAAIAVQRLDSGKTVLWTDCAALFRACHAAYADDGIEPVVARHAAASLLVLDEICLNDLPRDGEEILFAVLDRRHKAGAQTLLLGNANAEQARKWLGARITDRLRSGGVGFCFGEWDSMRGNAQDGAEF